MYRLLRPLTAAACLLALSACGQEKPATISNAKFVAANVAVRKVADSLPNAASLREAALKKEGVSAKDLQAWLDANARNPKRVARAWEEIAKRLDGDPGGPPGSERPVPGGQADVVPEDIADRAGSPRPLPPSAGGPGIPPSAAGGVPPAPGGGPGIEVPAPPRPETEKSVRDALDRARQRREQRARERRAGGEDSLPPVDQLNIRVRGQPGETGRP